MDMPMAREGHDLRTEAKYSTLSFCPPPPPTNSVSWKYGPLLYQHLKGSWRKKIDFISVCYFSSDMYVVLWPRHF
jgi:hypothetical protein